MRFSANLICIRAFLVAMRRSKPPRALHQELRVVARPGLVWAVLVTGFAAMTAGASTGPVVDDPVGELVVGDSVAKGDLESTVSIARAFCDFWNTGDEKYLKQVMADDFVDRTLPPGRPQGPAGPLLASRQFRAAIPDLRTTVIKMIVTGAYVTVHMVFTGHFSGVSGRTHGAGQPIRFIATDVLRVREGRITDDWHIEDNLALRLQMGLAKPDT